MELIAAFGASHGVTFSEPSETTGEGGSSLTSAAGSDEIEGPDGMNLTRARAAISLATQDPAHLGKGSDDLAGITPRRSVRPRDRRPAL